MYALLALLSGCGSLDTGADADAKARSTCTVSLLSPEDGFGALSGPPTFEWTGTCETYTLELSTLSSFPKSGTLRFNTPNGTFPVYGWLWDFLIDATDETVYWHVVGTAAGRNNDSETRTIDLTFDSQDPPDDTEPPPEDPPDDPPDDTPAPGDDPTLDPDPDPACNPPDESAAPPAPADCTTANSCKTITSCNVSWSSSIKYYYLASNIQSNDDDCLSPTVDNVTIYGDGTKSVTANGSWVDAIYLDERSGVVIDGVIATSIAIEWGERNTVRNSTAQYIQVDHSSNNLIEDNLIETDGGRALQVGDIADLQTSENTECNTVSDNVMRSENGDTDLFVKLAYVDNLTLDGNTIELINVRHPGTESDILTCYGCYDSRIVDNTMTIDMDEEAMPYNGNYRGGVITLRNGSSRNEIGGNVSVADTYRSFSIQAAGGYSDPADNWVHDNAFYDHAWTVNVQAMSNGTNQTRFERNLIQATYGPAMALTGMTSGAVVHLDGNTIVALDGDAVWDDEYDTNRTLVLRNNIFYAQDGAALELGKMEVDDDYNDYFSNRTAIMTADGQWTTALTWPDRGSHTLASDPKFVSAGSGDFRLQATSPLIGAGEGGIDMGAYQGE